VVRGLLSAQACVTAKNSYGETALMMATRLGHTEMLGLLKASLPLLDRVRFWLGSKALRYRDGM